VGLPLFARTMARISTREIPTFRSKSWVSGALHAAPSPDAAGSGHEFRPARGCGTFSGTWRVVVENTPSISCHPNAVITVTHLLCVSASVLVHRSLECVHMYACVYFYVCACARHNPRGLQGVVGSRCRSACGSCSTYRRTTTYSRTTTYLSDCC